MEENEELRKQRVALLAQDPPSLARASAHQELLFAKIHRRMQIEKALMGAGYVAVFFLAFYCFLRAGRVQDAANAVWWAASSLHLLLWFLVFFLQHIARLLDRIPSCAARARPSRGERWTVFCCALALCVFGTALLWKSAAMQDGVRLVQISRYVLWGPVFFLFWYPFGIASAVARLWLKHRELELQTSSTTAAHGSASPRESS